MGQKIAAFNSENAFLGFYDLTDSPTPSGSSAVDITDAEWQTLLAAVNQNQVLTLVSGAPTLQPPLPLTTAELAAVAMGAGLAIASTGTPALNGTYAIDQLSQMDIIAIETSLNAGKGFPGGATTFSYADTSGVMHSFTQANFTDLAASVRDYVYALKSVIAGASSTLPASTTTIP